MADTEAPPTDAPAEESPPAEAPTAEAPAAAAPKSTGKPAYWKFPPTEKVVEPEIEDVTTLSKDQLRSKQIQKSFETFSKIFF